MPKSLIVMGVIVVGGAVVAALAVTYFVATRDRNEAETRQQTPAEETSPTAGDHRDRTLQRSVNLPVARPGRRPRGKRHCRLSGGVPASPSADLASAATGSVPTSRVRRPPEPATSQSRWTPEDSDRLRKDRERSRYRLPSQWRIRALEASADESLHPTDAQRKEIDSVAEWLQGESQERLADILAEQQELRGRLSALYRQRAVIQKEIDGKFIEALRDVMSPEQMEIIEGKRRAVLPHPKDFEAP